jgi:uncharacterized membrane protein YeaQ/YmgE (transglycosylase-associated protein family)
LRSDLRVRIRSLFLKARVEEELDDELRFHQERQVEKFVSGGMSRDEALRRVRDVLQLVLSEGLKLILAGIVIGIIGALVLTRLLSSMLYGVGTSDPFTLGSVSLLLAAVALLACYVPARRAMRVNPLLALRCE